MASEECSRPACPPRGTLRFDPPATDEEGSLLQLLFLSPWCEGRQG